MFDAATAVAALDVVAVIIALVCGFANRTVKYTRAQRTIKEMVYTR